MDVRYVDFWSWVRVLFVGDATFREKAPFTLLLECVSIGILTKVPFDGIGSIIQRIDISCCYKHNLSTQLLS